MRISHFFIERPVFAVVVSVLIVLLGGIAYPTLPTAQYPEIVPPTVTVTANYPGASAETLAETVAEPIEEQINGVEKMLYMSSQSTGDGQMTITVTFELGTDLNQAQVLVENRVQVAQPRLPEQVRNTGVVVRKSSPDILLAIHFLSPDGSLDREYIGNYVTLNVRDRILRLKGVGDVVLRGDRDFSMRVWIDPARAAARGINASEITDALSRSNAQIAGGTLNQTPTGEGGGAYQLNIDAKGRLTDPEEFGDIVVKSDADGHVTRIRDVARIELGAQQYVTEAYLDEKEAVLLGVLQLPGGNALETAQAVQKTLAELKRSFPPGLDAKIVYNPTQYIADSLSEVKKTLLEALILVVIVVILFLQSWRAALVPVLAIPISLIGTFAVIRAAGFTLNNLSMFGLVLAIGIVVDDAIVVVENISRLMEKGSDPRKAAHETMDEVGTALIGIALVLTAVFVPAALIPGISGQFYRQFAITIATATLISLLVSLTLSPAVAALVMRPPEKQEEGKDEKETPRWRKPFATAADYFNRGFDWLSDRYGRIVGRVVRLLLLMLLVYAGLIALAGWRMVATPTGFIPDQDQGNVIISARLPEGASLARTRAVSKEIVKAVAHAPGVKGVSVTVGFDPTSNTNATNSIQCYVVFTAFKDREKHHLDIHAITADLEKRTAGILDADIKVIPPPPVRGIGTAGGFKLEIEDHGKKGYQALEEATNAVVTAAGGTANAAPGSRGGSGGGGSAATMSAAMENDQKSGRPGGTGSGDAQVTTTGAGSETGGASDDGGGGGGEEGAKSGGGKIDKSNVAKVFTTFNTRTPRLHADIDRQKAEVLGVQDSQVFSTLQTYLASSYINDFNFLGRTFQVRAQADWPYRQTDGDLSGLRTRSSSGAMVPLGSLVTLSRTTGPYRVARFNEYPAAEVQGSAGEGRSSGQAIATMEAIASKVLPAGFSYEWTEIAYQQTHTGSAAYVVFALAVVFAFLVLAALYESGTMPLAVLLIVPMCLLAAIAGIDLRGMDNNILTQVGLIVLVGLAAKNAILIVEFAKQDQDAGESPEDAAVHAAQTRLRPILMTSLAFILGVIPLAFAKGAGAELRQALGTAVFFGMIGVTIFGLLFTPVFFVATRKLAAKLPQPKNAPSAGRPQENGNGKNGAPDDGDKPAPGGSQPEPQT